MIRISQPAFLEDTAESVLAVLRSGQLAQGTVVREFENAFARYVGVRHAVACNSGTSALFLALLAHGIGPGDEVITSAFTFIATINAILYVGATPRLVDVDGSFNLDPAQVQAAITPNTKAVLPVYLYGQMAEMAELDDIARRHNLVILEDACQAHGAAYDGKFAGTFGSGCFSFYATKNMTTGEGGMLTTNEDEIADRARRLLNHGMQKRYQYRELGYNLRLTEIAAAIGIKQLARLDAMNRLRQENARYFDDHLISIRGLVLPRVLPRRTHVYHQYTLRLLPEFALTRAQFINALDACGIGSAIYYPQPVYEYPYLRDNAWARVRLTEAEMLSQQVVSIPVHPALDSGDREKIAETIRAIAG